MGNVSTRKKRFTTRRIAQMLTSGEHDALQVEIAADVLPAAIDNLRAGLDRSQHVCVHCRCHRPNRWATLAAFRLAKMLGMSQDLERALLAALGYAARGELDADLAMVRTVRGQTLVQKLRTCESFVAGVYAAHPELRGVVAPRLPEARNGAESHAEVADDEAPEAE